MSCSPPPVIRHARKTYARRRATSDLDTSFEIGNTSLDSREDPNSSISLGLDVDSPPDSDALPTSPLSGHTSDAADDVDIRKDHESFGRSWRAKLKQIDDGDYDIQSLPITSSPRDKSVEPATRLATPFNADQGSTNTSSGSLSVSNPYPSHDHQRDRSLPTSDSEPLGEVHPSTPHSSPPHTLDTPPSRSSPTPPTSIEPPQMPVGKGRTRGKKVLPLRLNSEDQSASGSKPSKSEDTKQQRNKPATKTRVKAPTKKENAEREKVTARIKAAQTVSIPQAAKTCVTLSDLFSRFQPEQRSRSRSPPIPFTSDPIQSFSSPVSREQQGRSYVLPSTESSDDNRYPTFSEMPQAERAAKERKEEQKTRQEQLRNLKLRAVQNQKSVRKEDDDSDLEIVGDDMRGVARDVAQTRRGMAARGEQQSRGRKRQLDLAGYHSRRDSGSLKLIDDAQAIRVMQSNAAAFPSSSNKGKDKLTHREMNMLLQDRASHQAQVTRREKEEDWRRRGGKIKEQPAETVFSKDPAQNYLEVLARKRKPLPINVDSESDGDWEPDQQESDAGAPGDGEHSDREAGVRIDADDQADDEEEEDDPLHVPRPRRSARRPIAAIDSDEDKGDIHMHSRKSVLDDDARARPLVDPNHPSSFIEQTDGTRTEDGTDKENDVRLSYDRGEDKENTVIALQSPVASMSLLASRTYASPSGSVGRGAAEGARHPLVDLPAEDDDDPFGFTPIPPLKLGRLSEGGSLEASPMNLGEGGSLQPAFSLKGKGRARFSSPSPGEPLELGGNLGGGGFSQFFTQDARDFDELKAAQANDDISLTMDAGLQPTLDVSRTFRNKADEVFGKEQEYIAQEELNKVAKTAGPQMFVDENGFLTQTRPQYTTLLGISPSRLTHNLQSPSPVKFSALSSTRRPLGSLDLDDDLGPRGRLMKRDRSPSPSGHVPTLRNAFDVLGQPRAGLKQKSKRRSEFIEGEAEESDDDREFGFGPVKRQDDEEEEDGDDQDQPLPELVDDREMDAETLAKEAVLEKAREHQEQDDLVNEKIQQDVVRGKYRLKRRDHDVGFNSDESSDEEGASRVRAAKKQRRENDNIAALKKDPSTRAFASEYQGEADDDDEFASLRKDRMDVDQEEGAGSEEEERELVSADQLREQLRQAARRSEAFEAFNPHDVSYLDDDEDDRMESEHRVREVSKEATSRRGIPTEGSTVQSKRMLGDANHARMARWAKSESSSRMVGVTGRNTGGSAAVTGLKSKAGSFKAVQGTASSSGSKGRRIAKGPSILSAVASKRGKFGN